MSLIIPVFAGLGSDSLFSRVTSDKAAEDASLPESQIILRTCLTLFREQVTRAVNEGHLSSESINLGDFTKPESLILPPSNYNYHVVVQHTSLYLVQVLRYLGSGCIENEAHAVAGFCIGLLPAAAIATTKGVVGLLQRIQDLFVVAVWIGIYSEAYRTSEAPQDGDSEDHQWSVVVNGPVEDIAKLCELTNENDTDSGIYVSAKTSSSRITLSGRPDQVTAFLEHGLPPSCKAHKTNVRTLYHSRVRLTTVFEHTLRTLESTMSSRWGVSVNSTTPLYSTITGLPILFTNGTDGATSLGDLISSVLEMILLEPVNWDTLQDNIMMDLQQRPEEHFDILNFGPGYGVSRSSGEESSRVTIRDVSATGIARLQGLTNSGLSLDDIAIVGMAVDLPGAQSPAELWQNLSDGINSCTEIPSSRFHVDDFFDRQDGEGGKSKRSMGTRYGNFLKNPFMFDNELFGISPREAKSVDPQQRVLLQTAYRALEDSGYVPDSTPSFDRTTFGCFIGNATLDYVDNLKSEIDVYYSPGTLRAFQSGRISYYFGWSGPSLTLDTACSSSMVAFHQAARSLAAGDCRAALVGGVNVITSPDMYLGLDRAHFLSPTGQCKAFDESADGYCRSEGCGIFVVKRLRDALAENDKIYGVVKGIEANQSGNAVSITRPHAPTQEVLFNRLFEKTNVDPRQISVVEAHGTGTQAGDPAELESLRRALCQGRDSKNLVHFTSIKANIGHCEAASGAAALAKVLLMLKHRTIPPQISLQKLNPKIHELGVDGAMITRVATPWAQSGKQPRLALINNFGAAGSNVAMLLSQYDQALPSAGREDNARTQMLGLSAKNSKALDQIRHELVDHLKTSLLPTWASLSDVCYTATARRQLYNTRLSVTASSIHELVQNLETAQVSTFQPSKTLKHDTVFVFSGQGSQYLGMGRELLSTYPLFAEVVKECDQVLRNNGYPGCLHIINADSTAACDMGDVLVLQSLQAASFALQVALFSLLKSWNITPTKVIGHSLGEFAALVAAGVLDVKSGALLVARRAQLMMELCELRKTSMLAANMAVSDAQAVIDSQETFKALSICCDNGANDCVVGGSIETLKAFKEHLASTSKTKSKLLDVPLAYHSEASEPICSSLKDYASTLSLSSPTIPIISTVIGRTVTIGEEGAFTPDYFPQHSRHTVRFREALGEIFQTDYKPEATHWVEIGPHAALLPLIASQSSQKPVGMLPCLRKSVSPSLTLSQLLGHFYKNSSSVDWRQAFATRDKPRMVELPGMPFQQTEFRIACPREVSTASAIEVSPLKSVNPFLAKAVQSPSKANGHSAIYETPIQPLGKFISGHIVCEHALCPASVYHQMALAAVKDIETTQVGTPGAWSLTKVNYVAPLLYSSQSTAVVRIRVTPWGQDGYQFEISSYPAGADPNRRSVAHCKGHLKRKDQKHAEDKYSRSASTLKRQWQRLQGPETFMETFSTKAMYEHVFTRVVTYSAPYQRVQWIRIGPDHEEAHARCRFGGCRESRDGASSIFMDVLLHVAGFVANLSVGPGEAGICKEVSSALVLREPEAEGALYDVYCSLESPPTEDVFVADAYATDEQGILAVFKGMVFQRVPLAKMTQAFAIQARRLGEPAAAAKNSSYKATSTPAVQRRVSPPSPPSTPPHEKASGAIQTSGIILEPNNAITEVRKRIAQSCGVDLAALSPTATLSELGFDSLLQIELESQLAERFPNVDLGDLSTCETIEDIEKLFPQEQQQQQQQPTVDSIPTPVEEYPPSNSFPQSSKSSGSSDVRGLARAVIAETCNVDPSSVALDSELETLGIDSLMMFELEAGLLKIEGAQPFTSTDLANCLTVGDVETLVNGPDAPPPSQEHTTDSSQRTEEVPRFDSTSATVISTPVHPPIVGIQTVFNTATMDKVASMLQLAHQPELIQKHGSSSSPPLFLIHDGSGICTHYRRLRSLNRTVYAIHDPKLLDPFIKWNSLNEMASAYAEIVAATTDGPCVMGGWSFGGVVAFEVARRLMAMGRTVIGTILIDSPSPLNHHPLSSRIFDAVARQGASSSTEAGRAIQFVTRQSFESCAQLLGAFSPTSAATLPPPPVFLLRSQDGWRYPDEPDRVDDKWLQDRSDPRTAIEGWETVTGSKVPSEDIPGDHFHVFHPTNIEGVSDAILRVLSQPKA